MGHVTLNKLDPQPLTTPLDLLTVHAEGIVVEFHGGRISRIVADKFGAILAKTLPLWLLYAH